MKNMTGKHPGANVLFVGLKQSARAGSGGIIGIV